MKFFTPILLIAIAGGVFWLYVNPTYATIKEKRAQEAQFDEALTNSKELIATRDQLLSEYNTFNANDLARLSKMVPDTVDNVRLVLDIDSIASRYGMSIRDVAVNDPTEKGDTTLGPNADAAGTVSMTFNVSSTYDNLIRFMKDLEQSLRIADVTDVSFTASAKDLSQYAITLKTYWLK